MHTPNLYGAAPETPPLSSNSISVAWVAAQEEWLLLVARQIAALSARAWDGDVPGVVSKIDRQR
jgi:hypothetical protein